MVPVYNKAAYLSECLNSLIKQSLREIEIVVVDDGSTDDISYLKDFYCEAESRIKWITLEKNVGRSEARNIGNKASSSDIICVQDADDMAVKERAEITYKFFKKKKVDVAFGDYYVVGQFGKILDELKTQEFDINTVFDSGYTFIGHSSMAYKKSVVLKTPYRKGEIQDLGIDDWALQIDLHYNGCKFGHIKKPLYFYRQVDDGISKVRDESKVKEAKGRFLEEIKAKD